jgi:hypothetical protein
MIARAIVVAATLFACRSPRCDDFVTLSFEVGGHDSDACSVVLAGPAASSEYDFPAPSTQSSCDGGACTRSTCTATDAPSYCARTLADGHDRIVMQLESAVATALATRLGSRNFTATVTCAGALITDKNPESVSCIQAAD